MEYKVLYTLQAKKDLADFDKKTATRILDKIDFFVSSGNPLKYAKKLVDFGAGTYRLRIGDYCVIFDLDEQGSIKILLILMIKHRKDVYL